MTRSKKPDPTGVDVTFAPRADAPRARSTYRVSPDGAVFVRCEFRNHQAVPTYMGIPPGGTWVQFRRIRDQSPTAHTARKLAREIENS